MYRRLKEGLPEDPRYPADLESLGFFINEKDQIRRLDDHEKEFVYKISNSERHNVVHAQAFYKAVRKVVRSRLKPLGIWELHLPQLISERPDGPHVSIYATKRDILCTKKRVIVLITDELLDLSVLSGQMLSGEEGLDAGSCIALVKELMSRSTRSDDTSSGCAPPSDLQANATPGFVVLNPGQLLYSYKLNKAMSRREWFARPAPSAAHPAIAICPSKNYVSGHATPEEHVASAFEGVISNPDFVNPQAEVYIIGIQMHSDLTLRYLDSNWSTAGRQVKAIALMQPQHLASSITDVDFAEFLAHRGRGWSLSAAPVGTALAVPSKSVRNGEVKPALAADCSQSNPLPTNPTKPVSRHQTSTSAVVWGETLPASSVDAASTTAPEACSVDQSLAGPEAAQGYLLPTHAQGSQEPDLAAVTQPVCSAGDLASADRILPTIYNNVLDWFEDMAHDVDGYRNAAIPTSEIWKEENAEAEYKGEELESEGATNSFEVSSVTAPGEWDPVNQTGADPELDEPTVEVAGVQVPKSLVERAGLLQIKEDEAEA